MLATYAARAAHLVPCADVLMSVEGWAEHLSGLCMVQQPAGQRGLPSKQHKKRYRGSSEDARGGETIRRYINDRMSVGETVQRNIVACLHHRHCVLRLVRYHRGRDANSSTRLSRLALTFTCAQYAKRWPRSRASPRTCTPEPPYHNHPTWRVIRLWLRKSCLARRHSRPSSRLPVGSRRKITKSLL